MSMCKKAFTHTAICNLRYCIINVHFCQQLLVFVASARPERKALGKSKIFEPLVIGQDSGKLCIESRRMVRVDEVTHFVKHDESHAFGREAAKRSRENYFIAAAIAAAELQER